MLKPGETLRERDRLMEDDLLAKGSGVDHLCWTLQWYFLLLISCFLQYSFSSSLNCVWTSFARVLGHLAVIYWLHLANIRSQVLGNWTVDCLWHTFVWLLYLCCHHSYYDSQSELQKYQDTICQQCQKTTQEVRQLIGRLSVIDFWQNKYSLYTETHKVWRDCKYSAFGI